MHMAGVDLKSFWHYKFRYYVDVDTQRTIFFNRLSHSQFMRREVNGQTDMIKLICFLKFPANAPKTEQA